MPLPPPFVQPTVSPAPIEPNTEQPLERDDKVTKKERYEEHDYSLTLDLLGYARIETPLLFGYLEFIKIVSQYPCRIVVVNANDVEEVVYNNNIRLRECAVIRTRTQDQNGRYHNMPCHILMNYPLQIKIYGSRESIVNVKVVLTKT